MGTDRARHLFRALYAYTFYLLFMEMFLLSTKRPHVSWVGLLVMALLFLISYILRNKVLHLWPLVLFTVVAGVGIWFLPVKASAEQLTGSDGLFAVDGMERWMLIGLALGLMVTSCRYVAKGGILGEPMDVPWPILVLGLLASAFGFIYDIEGLPGIAAILTGVTLIFYLLILYADSTRKYMDSTKDVRGIPIRQITKVNTIVIVGVFLCMIIVILLGEAVHLPDAFVGFLQAMLGILKTLFFGVVLVFRWIANLFGFGSKEKTHEVSRQLRQEATKPGTYSNILEFVLKGLLLALAVFVIIKILARVLRILSARYRNNSVMQRADLVEETKETDIRTKIPHPSLFKRMRDSISMEERARKIYRKRVMNLKKDLILAETDTTADIEEKALEQAGVSLPELTALYNNVRYGNVTVDRAYLSRMKQADLNRT